MPGAIGVDADQAYLGTHILTSATKKVDLAVFTTAGQVAKTNTFKGGTDGVFTVKNGGVGFGKVSVKAPNRAALDREADGGLEADRRRARSSRRAPAHSSSDGARHVSIAKGGHGPARRVSRDPLAALSAP